MQKYTTNNTSQSVNQTDILNFSEMSYSDFDSLLNSTNLGAIIDTDTIEQIQNMLKRKDIETLHPYSISEPKKEGSRWQTYVIKDGVRSKMSAMTERDLINKLYDFYHLSNLTLEMLFPTWTDIRKDKNISSRTIARNKNHWDKYYKGHSIVEVPVQSITTEMLEDFFNECIRKHSLKLKELDNMKIIALDILKFCKRKRYISANPCDDMEINRASCQTPNNPNDASRIFLPEEITRFFKALEDEMATHPKDTDCLAIFLQFKLGLRIGELCALKKCDFDFEQEEVHIHRMETLSENADGKLQVTVVEHTKKKSIHGDRYLPFGDYEVNIIQKINAINKKYGYVDDDFLFCDKQGRTRIREIDNRIRKICEKANILPAKSAHDIRRTVATEMYRNGTPLEDMRKFLGHSDIKTTLGYIVDIQEKATKQRKIKSSLSALNGLADEETPKVIQSNDWTEENNSKVIKFPQNRFRMSI